MKDTGLKEGRKERKKEDVDNKKKKLNNKKFFLKSDFHKKMDLHMMLNYKKLCIETFQLYQKFLLRKKVVGRVRGLLSGTIAHMWIEVEMIPGKFTVYDVSDEKPIILPSDEYYEKFGIKYPELAEHGIFRTWHTFMGPDNIEWLRPHKHPECDFFVYKEVFYLIYHGGGKVTRERKARTIDLFEEPAAVVKTK